jgi:transcriptional regulator with XRE-family HTH domain
MNLGENIKRFRLEKGLTQEQLANAIGVSNQAVSKWECDGSIPDGLLFVPISNALGVSIDRLFGREITYEQDIYGGIVRLINNEPFESKMEKAREICWQTEKGLFGCSDNDYYHAGELSDKYSSSYVSNDTGFSCISNHPDRKFFSLFVKPENGYEILKQKQFSETFTKLFAALGDEYVMKAFYVLYSKPDRYTFEKEVLAAECGIPDNLIENVMEKLHFIVTSKEITVNDEKRTVYAANQRHELIAMLFMATEFFYAVSQNNGYQLQACCREKPLFY